MRWLDLEAIYSEHNAKNGKKVIQRALDVKNGRKESLQLARSKEPTP